jgi:dephospho-CoA kinase
MCDRSILVTAPLSLKLKRVTGRDNSTEAQVLARMDKQLSDEKKTPMADDYIRNDESESIISQVLTLHQKYLHKKF